MRIIFRLLLIYLLFLIQTAVARPSLDLVLLGLVIFALHDPPSYALITAIWAGFLLGLVNPISIGFHITVLTAIAFACNNIRRIIYKNIFYFLSIVFFALLFKYLLSLIFLRGGPNFLTWLVSITIILVIAIPIESLIINIFYQQWRMKASEENY